MRKYCSDVNRQVSIQGGFCQAESMVANQLLRAQPAELMKHIGNVVAFTPTTNYTSTEIQQLLNAMQLGFAAGSVHSNAIPDRANNECVHNMSDGPGG